MTTITQIKVVILGDEAVGKTSLLSKWISGSYNDTLAPTVGGATQTRQDIIDGTKYLFQIWDTAGAERYRALTPLYTRDAAAALIVFDLTRQSSVDNIPQWVEFIGDHGKMPYILVGNKEDLVNNYAISIEDATELAFQQGSQFFSTSAKTGNNVDLAFRQLELAAVEHFTKSGLGGNEKIVIEEAAPKSGGCC